MKNAFALIGILLFATAFGATRTEAIREKLMSGDRDYVFVAMHRGDWRNFPENSKGAILSSIRLGADIVELDVHMTKDGRFILNHDNTFDRTTTGKGKVHDLGMGRHLNCGGDFGAERRCFGELSKKQDGDMTT